MALQDTYASDVESYLVADSSITRITQTFVTSSAYDIGFISFWLYRDEATGTIAFELRDTDGAGKPNNLLKSGAIPQSDVPVGVGNAAWVTLEINDESLSNATKYALILYHNTEESLFAGRSSLDGGVSGTSGISEDAGGTWSMSATFDLLFRTYDSDTGYMPVNPTPADGATGVDFSGFQLSWEYESEEEDYFDVYIGETGALTKVSDEQAAKSYTTDATELETIYGEYPVSEIFWRVDRDIGGEITTGEEWSFETGSAPTKAENPTPSDTNTSVTLGQATITWEDGGGADTYDVYYGTQSGNLTKVSTAQAGTSFTVTGITNGSPYAYLSTRYWRIDSTNGIGTTTGDEWTFTTLQFDPPGPTYFYNGQHYQLLTKAGDVVGTHPADGGVENTDYVVVSFLPNFIRTSRRLVSAANSKIWYEDV
ncbi:MAG: hypothetical protein GY938_30905 [Ketobacter sp.]|nr:hypothetical protein [Ketobacter sp.]